MDLTRYRPSLHAHDFTPGGNSRVVMIRKKEQRTFASAQIGKETHFETLTKETVQVFRGNKIERKITSQISGSQEINTELLKHFSSITTLDDNENKKKVTTGSLSSLGEINGEKKSALKRKDSAGVIDASKFAAECLTAHNEKRALHKAPPLKLSKKLCKYSEEWAKHLASSGKMQHRSESAYGENLFLLWSSKGDNDIKGSEPVDNWYAEIADHVFHKEPSTLKTGHFTQVVWTESEELGVGVARSQDGKQMYVVCNYNPPGNFIGSFAENVPPIGGFDENERSNVVTNDEEFQKSMLRIHNEYRKRHGVPPLKLADDLSNYAQDWAKTLTKFNKLEHRQDSPFGENLFCLWGAGVASARDACLNWYNEVRHFNYHQEPRALKSPNFTQMLWRDTKEIGVGRARGRQGNVYIVANYRPLGNIVGQFKNNVFRPL